MSDLKTQIENDLEDGEIRDDLEDVSDCSLSAIVTVKQDLEEDDTDVNLLREEALKSMYELDEADDEALEEEEYRLEALKSLLQNMEFSEQGILESDVNLKRKSRRKRKREKNHNSRKRKHSQRKYQNASSTKSRSGTVNSASDLNNLSNKINDIHGKSRSWYPNTDLALTVLVFEDDNYLNENIERLNYNEDFSDTIKSIVVSSVNQVVHQSPLAEIEVTNSATKVVPSKPFNFKKATKYCIRNFNAAMPMINRFNPSIRRKINYSLINKSKYVVRNTTTQENNKSFNSPSKSIYCINRVKCPKVEFNPREFVIELDDGDSSNEEDEATKENIVFTNLFPENCAKVSSTCEESIENVQTQLFNVSNLTLDKKHCKGGINEEISGSMQKRNNNFTESADCSSYACNEKLQKNSDSLKMKSMDDDTHLDNICNEGLKRDISSVLIEAETNLIQIREKLLSDLNDLDNAIKQNDVENDKLKEMMRKLILLKLMVEKCQDKVKLQNSKLSLSVSYVNSLLSGVELRTKTCLKFKEICVRAGRSIVGFEYKPPEDYEDLIMTRRNNIDLSKLKGNKT